ncbi:MAG: hypothetical protein OXF88_01935 [Rhodobacteraceae bacterium]|nr:hypothetical protein [Paracoccaceae bacterium]MCY4140667.1 hypothetical protein [Paracoccaceae bacterium]
MKSLCLMPIPGLLALPYGVSAERCRQIAVAADEKLAGNVLWLLLIHDDRTFATVSADGALQLPVGSPVDLCFESSTDGYVSLRSRDEAGGSPVRILPNDDIDAADDELGIAAEAGMARRFSELLEGPGVSLRVQPPYEEAEVYLHYSEVRDGQIGPGDFPSIGNRTFKPGRSCDPSQSRSVPRSHDEPYASSTVRYEVVE